MSFIVLIFHVKVNVECSGEIAGICNHVRPILNNMNQYFTADSLSVVIVVIDNFD